MGDGQIFNMVGEGDNMPGQQKGDVVCVLQGVDHPRFKRSGNDLVCRATVPLAEALCGCKVNLRHLDGRSLQLKTEPNRVIKPGSWRVRQEGMPVFSRYSARGDLIVQINVTMPDVMTRDVAEGLVGALSP